MPWREVFVSHARLQFVLEVLQRKRPRAMLCAEYGISRKTGYKWVARFRAGGAGGLVDRSHIPHACPQQLPVAVRRELLRLRRVHPTWGRGSSSRMRARSSLRSGGPRRARWATGCWRRGWCAAAGAAVGHRETGTRCSRGPRRLTTSGPAISRASSKRATAGGATR